MTAWLILFAVSLLLAVFFGRIYCGYICPMNTLMLPAEWISKKLGIQTDKRPDWLKKGFWPWLFLILSFGSMVILKRIFHIDIPILIIWLLISFLVTLRYKPDVFHNLLCPFGPLQRIFGKFAFFSKRVEEDKCIGCRKCEAVCPSLSINVGENKKAVITTEMCHQCTNCADVCPTDAILYKKIK